MVDVTGVVLAPDGSPVPGDVCFELIGVPADTPTATYSGGYVRTPFDATGAFAVSLVATDDPELVADGDSFSYALQLRFDGEHYWRAVLLPAPGPYTLDTLPPAP